MSIVPGLAIAGDSPGEVRDGHGVPAVDTPNIGQQTLSGFGRNAAPQLGRWWGEGGQGFDESGPVICLGCEAALSGRVNWNQRLHLPVMQIHEFGINFHGKPNAYPSRKLGH